MPHSCSCSVRATTPQFVRLGSISYEGETRQNWSTREYEKKRQRGHLLTLQVCEGCALARDRLAVGLWSRVAWRRRRKDGLDTALRDCCHHRCPSFCRWRRCRLLSLPCSRLLCITTSLLSISVCMYVFSLLLDTLPLLRPDDEGRLSVVFQGPVTHSASECQTAP